MQLPSEGFIISKMDIQGATEAVYKRIQAHDAAHASKLLAWLLSQPRPQQEVMRLAMASDMVLHSTLLKARRELNLMGSNVQLTSNTQKNPSASAAVAISQGITATVRVRGGNLTSTASEGQQWRPIANGGASKALGQELARAVSPPRIRSKIPCFFFAKGTCKNGDSCRFLHLQTDPKPGHSPQPPPSESSMQQLEQELKQLLVGLPPVHVSSVPKLYLEHFGKALNVKNLETGVDTQRHGLTLMGAFGQMSETISFIHRKQGPPLVVLKRHVAAAPAQSSSDCPVVYLTFPPESTFNENDVRQYFKSFGPVQEVKMPSSTKRMFAYVTFKSPNPVKAVLATPNPHTIAGCKVLVKPYKERGTRPKDRFTVAQRVLVPKAAAPSAQPVTEATAQRMQKEELDYEAERRRQAILQIKEGSAQKRRMEVEAAARVVAAGATRAGAPAHTKSVFTAEQLNKFQHDNLFGLLQEDEDGEGVEEEEAENVVSLGACTIATSSGGTFSFSDSTPVSKGALSPQQTSSTSMSDLDYTCSVCLEFFQEPIELDCHHTFCVPCISQVIKATKEECPICRQRVSPHMARYLETRDPHWTVPSAGHHQRGIHQHATTASAW